MTASQETYKSLLKVSQIYNSIEQDDCYTVKMVQNILKKEGNINQLISYSILPDSSQSSLKEYTILHLAAIKQNIEIFKFLLDNGADFTLQNQHGCTVLHYLFDCDHDSDNEFINYVLSAHVRFGNRSNPCSKDGISHFHIACITNHAEAVQFFFDNTESVGEIVNFDSNRFPGYSPLHLAAEGCSIDVIKILIKNHANINQKDGKGRTPLHIFLHQKLKLFDTLKESNKEDSKLILKKIGKMDDATNLLLHSDDMDDIGLSQLHVACTSREVLMHEYYIHTPTDIHQHVNFDSPVWPGYTALHFAAHGNIENFKMLIRQGAVVEAKDAEGITPLDIRLKKCKAEDVVAILKCKHEWSLSKFTDGKTQLVKLLTAMCVPEQFETYLVVAVGNVDICVAENPPFWTGFTPLHFAVLISHSVTNIDLLQRCLKRRPGDLYAQDIHGRTPIHLAFHMKKIELTIFLLNIYNGEDLLDEEDVSLHNIAQKLIEIPSALKVFDSSIFSCHDKDDTFEKLGFSQMHAASYSSHIVIMNRLLKISNSKVNAAITCTDSKIFWSQYVGYTPLHLAIERPHNTQTVDVLLLNGADIFAARPDGMTPIYAVLRDISKNHLISRFYSLLKASNLSLSSKLAELSGITMLHIACRMFDKNVSTSILGTCTNVNSQVRKDSPIWAGYTPLHVLLKYAAHVTDQHVYKDVQFILKKLLTSGADLCRIDDEGNTPIHLSFDHCIHDNDFMCMSDLIHSLKNFKINPVNEKGISHLHAACLVNNIEAVKKLLKCIVDVNQPIGLFVKNFTMDTPLHLVFKRGFTNKNQLVLVDLLLTKGANIHAEDSFGYTLLHKAACENAWLIKFIERCIKQGADVNTKNIFGETPIECFLKLNEIPLDGIKVLLNSGCQLNSCNDITEEGYLSMIIDKKYHKSPQSKVFDKIMKFSDKDTDLTNNGDMHRTALQNVVTISKVNDADTISYLEIIDQFQNLGINLDHKDRLGKTALHLASRFRNVQAVEILVNSGADVNIVDSNNKTALSYALEVCNNDEYHHDEIIKTLVTHIRKLQYFKLGVNKLNEDLMEEYHLTVSFDNERLSSEMEHIKGIVVDTEPQLLLHDCLYETEALTNYPFTIASKQKQVAELLKSTSGNAIELKSVLMYQYRKILKKVIA